MRTTGTNRAVPGKRIDSHLITSLVLSAGTARKKEEAAYRFLSFILIYAPQERIGYAQRSNDHHRPASLVLAVGAYRQKEEAASRFLSFILLVTVRSNEPGEPNGVTITTRPSVSYYPWGWCSAQRIKIY